VAKTEEQPENLLGKTKNGRMTASEERNPSAPVFQPLPLSSICATTRQEGTKDCLRWRIEPHQELWEPLVEQLQKVDLPMAFLLNTATAQAAAADAAAILQGRWGKTETVELRDEFGTEEVWAFVSLGTWTNCPYWVIESAFLAEHELVVNYEKVEHLESGRANYEHAYFIPLGKRPPGWFTVRLIDRGRGVETLVVRARLVAPSTRP